MIAACVALSCAASAQDEYDGPLPVMYFGPLGGYVSQDSARDAEQALNVQVILGALLADSLALEVNGFGTELTRESDSERNDYLYGGGLDFTLGTAAPGNPIFLLGGGAVVQDIATVKKTSSYGNLGVGLYLPFSLAGELWRLEGRYNVVFNDHPDPSLAGKELLEDVRVNLGFLMPIGRQERPVQIAEAESEPVAPLSDSDGDGVGDDVDRCPDTPKWVRPDATGCAPDADGDGVDETMDRCPDTPAGVAVDGAGCEPTVATTGEPLALPPDADGDGVYDGSDACPHTVPRYNVDSKGCLIPEDVSMKNVHFDINSARLTADGYALLHSLSAALKADVSAQIEIGGHADSTGGDKFNRSLAAERAKVVFDFLTYTGLDGARFAVKTYGESAPVADNKTQEGRAKNRRVTFKRLSK